jgi:hypothetical protein
MDDDDDDEEFNNRYMVSLKRVNDAIGEMGQDGRRLEAGHSGRKSTCYGTKVIFRVSPKSLDQDP